MRCGRPARRCWISKDWRRAHRGSLLGALPGQPQPSQKAFDSALVHELSGFDVRRPVFVEAEGRRIGAISTPDSLLGALHAATCVEVEARREDRIAFLLQDYAHLFDDPAFFKAQLAKLIALHSRERVAHWHRLIDDDARAELFAELIDRHYDLAYVRSSRALYTELPHAAPMLFRPNDADSVEQAKALPARLDETAPALDWIVFLLIAVVGLFYVKWFPYYNRAFVAASQHSIGKSILMGTAASAPSPSWQAALDYALAYGKAIWQAMVLGLLLGSAVQALIPPRWVARARRA